MTNPYDDIIHLPHHVSTEHPHMPLRDRAAQFSPFAALVGYEDIIAESARRTSAKRELDESEKAELDRRLAVVASHLAEKPEIEVEYFVRDARKEGGEYVSRKGIVARILPVARKLVLADGTVIRVGDIVSIGGELFRGEF